MVAEICHHALLMGKEKAKINNSINEIGVDEILKIAIDNGIIDIGTISEQAIMKKREKVLSKHTEKIWQGNDGYWRTYVKDFSTNKRKMIKKISREKLDDALFEIYNQDVGELFSKRYLLWVERQRLCGRSDNTIYKYGTDYKRFFAGTTFENRNVKRITDEHIMMLILDQLDKGINYKALKGMVGIIRGVMNKCIKDKIIDSNPCDYIDLEIYKSRCVECDQLSEERVLSDEELDVFIARLKNDYIEKPEYMPQYAIELALYTGMRVGELSALKWSDIDYDKGVMVIKRSEKYNKLKKEYFISETKNRKIRKLPLTDDMIKLFEYIKGIKEKYGYSGEWVFSDENGIVDTRRISECVRNRTMYIGFDHNKSIHGIRRTVNSHMRMNGVSSAMAASLLGHTPRVNENHYTYDVVSVDKKKEIMSLAAASGIR